MYENNRKSANYSSQSKRAKTSSIRKPTQVSNKIFVNKHLSGDPEGVQNNPANEVSTSADFEASEITNFKRSGKSVEVGERSAKVLYDKKNYYNDNKNIDVIYNHVNLQYHHRMIDPAKFQERNMHNRSNSHSKVKKKKGITNMSISKMKASVPPTSMDFTLSKAPHTTKSSQVKNRKSSIEMKMKVAQMLTAKNNEYMIKNVSNAS